MKPPFQSKCPQEGEPFATSKKIKMFSVLIPKKKNFFSSRGTCLCMMVLLTWKYTTYKTLLSFSDAQTFIVPFPEIELGEMFRINMEGSEKCLRNYVSYRNVKENQKLKN